MDLSQFFIMRHEVLLLAVIILILLMEIFVGKANRKAIIPVSIGLFLLSTLAGFLPAESGQLFGDMYRTNGLIVSMKNILNIGVLIVMLLSAEWLRKEENLDKVSEYYLIMLSTLVGMFYMISSGDFLMFYLGLELASIP
ncbi:MAG TPA: NADH-quinone oxidoreductase subunit N, partial [Bacteroidales bacterium]|nr:NADH-quinone oxidoreductase subunit N [Bacteroidales bacterium]